MNSVYIVYGSQTGQSEGIAEEIFDVMNNRNMKSHLLSMEELHNIDSLANLKTAVFITSSTGDGDPPDNAVKFFRQLRMCESLKNLSFTLLGLGDSNYTTFLGFPKALKKTLEDKGAKMFYPAGWADDAVGLETVVDPWIEGLWPALEKHFKGDENASVVTTKTKEESNETGVQSVLENLVEQKEMKLNGLETPEGQITMPGGVCDEKTADDLPALEPVELKELECQQKPTLKFSPDLAEKTLKIPALPRQKLQIKFLDEVLQAKFEPKQVKFLPSSAGPIVHLPVSNVRMLTAPDADKCALEVTLDKEGNDLVCEPGDSIGIICPNSCEEVDAIISRLELTDCADKLIQFSGEAKDIPSHFPERSTLRSLLLYHCDIRCSPRKILLRLMADYAGDETEKRRLQELSSIEGASEYNEFVRDPNISFLDLLDTFPSTKPPIERVLEQLLKLLPRAYSIVTARLKDPDHLAFVFKILEFPAEYGRTRYRKGVATGWISDLTSHLWKQESIAEQLDRLNLEPVRLSIYPRANTTFRLPSDLSTPIIMVGPGSGVAPFIGFMQQREELVKRSPTDTVGACWLFYGCRHENKDFLYRSEIERLKDSGILTRFYAAFSKSPVGGPRYVQELLKIHCRPIVNLLLEKGAFLYVCGDAKGMAKDVYEAVADAITAVKGVTAVEGRAMVAKLQIQKRYLQDVWS